MALYETFVLRTSLSANKLKLSALRWAFLCTSVRPLIFNLFRYAPPQAVRDVTHNVRQIPEMLSQNT